MPKSAKDLLNLDEDDGLLSDAYSSGEEQSKGKSTKKTRQISKVDENDEDEDDEHDEDTEMTEDGADTVKPLSEAEMRERARAIRKSGVIYLSKVPPYMKPGQFKQILERFGPVGRIFLNPESEKERITRVKSGGNRQTKFKEGWAEFTRKQDAKLAAETLNGNKLGGKKGSFYYDDILNIKYLKNFKWHDLTEGMAIEAQERRERLKAEIAQATKENKIFIENVERKAMFDKIKEKKGKVKNPIHRTFHQRETHDKKSQETTKELDDVLSKVF